MFKYLGAALGAIGATDEFHMATSALVMATIPAIEFLQPKPIGK